MSGIPLSLAVFRRTTAEALASIVQAECAGVPAAWLPAASVGPDPVTILAAAAVQTKRIRLGSAIVPTYTRHPATLAGQALALAELAPGRFSLGVGSGHRFVMEGMFGLSPVRPVAFLREYLTVLRALLWTGSVDFAGDYFRVRARLPDGTVPPRLPIPIAALRAGMFRLAGEAADGAIAAWCPMSYLLRTAIPALRDGARAAGRPTPPLIANVPVVLHSDFAVVRRAAHAAVGPVYGQIPVYREMFAAAGLPLDARGRPDDALIEDLFVYGDAPAIAARLRSIHQAGVDQLMITIHAAHDPLRETAAVLELLGQVAAGR